MRKTLYIFFILSLSTLIYSANLNYLLDIKYRDFPDKKFVRLVLYLSTPPLFQEIKKKDPYNVEIVLTDTDIKKFYGNLKIPSQFINEISTTQNKKNLVININLKSEIVEWSHIKSDAPPLLYIKISTKDAKTLEPNNIEDNGTLQKFDNATPKQLPPSQKIIQDNSSKIVKRDNLTKLHSAIDNGTILDNKSSQIKQDKKIEVDENILKIKIDEARNFYNKGLQLMAEKKYTEAIDIFDYNVKNSDKTNPFNFKSRYRIVDCVYYNGDPKDAKLYMSLVREYIDLISNYPDKDETGWAAFQLANCYKKMGFFEEALGSYKYVIKYFPDSEYKVNASIEEGNILYLLKKYQDALNSYKELLTKSPDSVIGNNLRYLIGNCLYELKKYNEAKNIYEEALKRDTTFADKSPEMLYNIANTYFYLKKYTVAREYFMKIRNLFPNSNYFDLSLLKIGETYLQDKDYNSALYIFKRVVDATENTDNIIVARLEMADIGLEKKIKDKDVYEKYKNFLDPDTAYNYIINNYGNNELVQIAMSRLINYYLDQSRNNDALIYLEEFYSRFPESNIKQKMDEKMLLALNKYILDLFKVYDYGKVIYFYEKYKNSYLKEFKPLDVYKAIFLSYKNLDLSGQGRDILENLSAKYNNDPDIQFELIEDSYKSKAYKKVILEAGKYYQKYPESKKINRVKFYEALSYKNLKNYQKASNILFDLLKSDIVNEDKGRDVFYLAEIFRETGDYENALKLYSTVTENYNEEILGKNIIKDSYFYAGYMKYLLKNYQDAVNDFTNFRNLYPEHHPDEVIYYIISSFAKNSKYEEALNFFENNKNNFKNEAFLKLSSEVIDNIKWSQKLNLDGK